MECTNIVDKERNSAVELLRIIAAMAVILLHYNSSGGAFRNVIPGSINQYWLYFTESVCDFAVDFFVIVSGYFLSENNNRNINKIISLFLQFTCFKAGSYFLTAIINNCFSVKGVIYAFLPTNYFLILYSTLYILSPYINVMVAKMSKQQFHKLLTCVIVIFSLWSTLLDYLSYIVDQNINAMSTIGIRGTNAGYSIVNFFCLYLIGTYFRKYLDVNSISKAICMAIVITTIIGIYAMSLIEYKIFYSEVPVARNYDNILVIASACGLTILVLKIQFYSRVINILSKATFTSLLLNDVILQKMNIEKYVNGSTMILIAHQLLTAGAVYFISFLVYELYSVVSGPFLSILEPINVKVNNYLKVE